MQHSNVYNLSKNDTGLMTKSAKQTCSSFDEIHTVVKDIKSGHVSSLMLQMCLTWLFSCLLSVLCRTPPGLFQERLQSPGA